MTARVPATASSWNRVPFTDGRPLAFHAVFSADEFARLANGLVPERMEDKWFVYYDAPCLYFHRSWSGEPVYRVTLNAGPEGVAVSEALWATTLADAHGADPHYQAALLDFLISDMVGKPKLFPRPAGLAEPVPGLFQHHVAGTSRDEVVVPPKARWWRRWRKG